jgi:hypothetical protein
VPLVPEEPDVLEYSITFTLPFPPSSIVAPLKFISFTKFMDVV